MAFPRQSLLRTPSVLVFVLSIASLFLLAVVLLPLASGADPQAATLAPFTITGHRPVTHEVGVPLSAVITATFDEDVNATTVTSRTFVVHGNLGGTATGTFDYDGASRTLTLDPDRTFHAGEVLRVSATSAISSAGDTSLAPYGWQFSAGDVYVRCLGGFINVEAGLTGVTDSSVAWGDYDKDGDLDILLTGQDEHADWVSKVYRNNGEGATPAFTDISAGLAGLRHSAVAWGDLDNDGDLDIVLTGQDKYGHGVSKVYRNDWDTPAPAFTDMYAGLTGVYHGSVAMGDCDNDGDLDILLTGWSPLGYASKVYRNDGDGSFTDIGAGLTGVGYSSVAWGDYDNDGDLDVLLAGWSGSASVSKVYRNSGAGAFSDIGAALTGVLYSSVAWGDYDNDGDLDILLTGSGVSKVYRNNGAGNFTDVGAGLSGVSAGSAVWGDHDNDGDLDILLTGTHVSQVYRNDGAGVFTDIGAGLTGVCYSSVAWGDYDRDGDLDILLTGQDSAGAPVSEVYRNDDCRRIISHSPQAHAVGVATTAAITATFDRELDASTATSRTFAVHGHLGGLLSGTYGYDGPSRTMTLNADRAFHAGEVLRVSASSAIRGTEGQPLSPYGWQFTAGDVFSRCVARFTDIGTGLTDVDHSSVAWGDYDNDGDLDILLTGLTGSGGVSRVYRNGDDGSFTDIAAGLTGVLHSSVAWGDYDSDGDLDILLTGYDGATMVAKVYRNDGGGSFTDIDAGLTGLSAGSVAWGDYDNDGDLDILLTGMDGSYARRSKVYRNDGGGDFTDIGAGLTGVGSGCAAWGDYDNDGDLDILLTGWTGSGRVSRVYRNDGGGAFTDISAGLAGVYRGSVAWGDYDNDGDLDILLTGHTGSAHVSKVYRNDGGAFTDIDAGLTGVYMGSVAWGDCDNDGDLDILLTGEESYNVGQSKVYRNDDCPKLDTVKAVHTSTAQPGDVITYTIVIANNGDTDGTGAVVSDTLPAGLGFAGPVALIPAGAGTTGTPPILLSSATITAGAAITLTFPVTVNTGLAVGAVVTNTAAVSCSEVATPVEASVPITIANVAPTLGAVDPASGSGPPGVTAYFTATWQDANGWEDLKHCYFHIGDSPTIAGNVTLLYNALKDKLWLRSDDGSMWLGGYAPGTANLLENSQAKVHCAATSAEGDGDTLVVKWLIEFKAGYAGTKKLGLKGKDREGAKAKGAWKGTWTITP